MKENNELKKRFEEQPESSLLQSGFLKVLIEATKKKVKLYSEQEKMIALYIYITGGKQLYDNLQANLGLPSHQTILRYLHDSKSTKEGEFDFDGCADFIKRQGYVNYVWLSEDDTKVNPGLRYDKKEDIIVGFNLPINHREGIPELGVYKFSSIKALQNYLHKSKVSSYVKLISVKSLTPGSVPFVLVMYGTSGSDDSVLTANRWTYVQTGLAAKGIFLIGKEDILLQFSSQSND